MQQKPVLYVDVDGVISLWGFDTDTRPAGDYAVVDGIPHFLSAEAGEHLLTLGGTFDLVWCTGWEEKANEHLVPALGLDAALPYLGFDALRGPGHTTPGHWKLPAVDAHAGTRPAAWVDDAFNEACFAWARDRAAPTLLVATEPPVGLTGEHAARLIEWAAGVAG